MFWSFFGAGLIIGVAVGIIVMALCNSAKISDQEMPIPRESSGDDQIITGPVGNVWFKTADKQPKQEDGDFFGQVIASHARLLKPIAVSYARVAISPAIYPYWCRIPRFER